MLEGQEVISKGSPEEMMQELRWGISRVRLGERERCRREEKTIGGLLSLIMDEGCPWGRT